MVDTTNQVYADVQKWIEQQTQKEEASVEALIDIISTTIENEVGRYVGPFDLCIYTPF